MGPRCLFLLPRIRIPIVAPEASAEKTEEPIFLLDLLPQVWYK